MFKCTFDFLELYFGILKNQELTEYVVEMLLEHFSKYYEKDADVLPPLIFDKCTSIQGVEVVLQEPLADLIFALQKIYVKVASKDSSRIDKLAVVLESLCVRMAQMDLEHMGLVSDFSYLFLLFNLRIRIIFSRSILIHGLLM